MTPQLDKIRAEAAFDDMLPTDRYISREELAESCGAEHENARLNAIIEKLIRVIERQDAALEFYKHGLNWMKGPMEACSPIIADTGTRASHAQAEARAILSGEG